MEVKTGGGGARGGGRKERSTVVGFLDLISSIPIMNSSYVYACVCACVCV